MIADFLTPSPQEAAEWRLLELTVFCFSLLTTCIALSPDLILLVHHTLSLYANTNVFFSILLEGMI